MTTRPSTARRRAARVVAPLAAAAALITACSGSFVHNYRTFQSAVDRGASCAELFDQRARFDDTDTLAKIDVDLKRIGCASRDATRTDR